MRPGTVRVRQYELMTIISPDVAEEDLQSTIEHITSIVETAGGTVTLINREAPWGRRRLAYPIRHTSRDVRDGFYVLFYVEVDAAKVIEIERDIKLTDSIMRYLVTQQVAPAMIPVSELEAAAAAQAAADAEEDEIEAAMAAAAIAAEGAVAEPAEPGDVEVVVADVAEPGDVEEVVADAAEPGDIEEVAVVVEEPVASEEAADEETSSAEETAGDDAGDKS